MDKTDHGIKRKSTIAVFEHVGGEEKQSKNKKFRTNRFLSEDSPSESELVIDDKPVRKKNLAAVKLSEEPLTLRCQWTNCTLMFMNYNFFIMHIMEHYQQADLTETLVCSWGDCGTSQTSFNHLKQHISYHGYVTKLINIGSNVLLRSNLPTCKESPKKVIFPIEPNGYLCEWEYCDKNLDTITEFIDHMIIHVKNNPRISQADDVVKCYWKGCGNSFTTQYKLAEHIRVHTKEKTLACPTCFKMFSSKTKFRDHRKRQLSTDLQSYQCSQCLKLFASERLLRDHMRSHINHYKCNMCDMTCPKPSNLAMHIRMKHIKIKNFKCDKCSKGFVRLSNLRTHMLTHANHKYACEECDFKSKSLYALRKHYGVAHEQDIPVYQCHNCDESFKRGGHLTTHLMKKHNYHWPSGHSRFKYRRDHDGIFRLQTVRYESLEVTEEMIRSETQQKQTLPQSVSYNITYGDNTLVSLPESDIKKVETSKVLHTSNNLLITIEDVDEHGNVMNSEVIESNELFLSEQRDASAESQTEDELGEFLILNSTNSIKNEQDPPDEHKPSLEKVENTTDHLEQDTTDARNSIGKLVKSKRKSNKLLNINQIKDELDDQPAVKSSKKHVRKSRGKRKTTVQVKAEEANTTETIHYFSKDVILNYDKFKIVSNKK